MNRAETGRRGEAAAARWYQKQGAQLLTHNYHTRMGELDLVLREPDGTIVICEVKTRSQGMLQRPAAAVDPAKQHRLICAAQGYLQQTGQSEEPVCCKYPCAAQISRCCTRVFAADRPKRRTGAF